VLELLAAQSAVRIFDRTPRANSVLLGRIAQLLQPFRYIAWCLKGGKRSLYLALSGGHGQFFDWPYVMIAKVFRSRIFIHHHSFAYLNSPSFFNRVFFSLVRKETHIVLSGGMGLALSNTWTGLDLREGRLQRRVLCSDQSERKVGREFSFTNMFGFSIERYIREGVCRILRSAFSAEETGSGISSDDCRTCQSGRIGKIR
jgi:hypothetical protein